MRTDYSTLTLPECTLRWSTVQVNEVTCKLFSYSTVGLNNCTAIFPENDESSHSVVETFDLRIFKLPWLVLQQSYHDSQAFNIYLS